MPTSDEITWDYFGEEPEICSLPGSSFQSFDALLLRFKSLNEIINHGYADWSFLAKFAQSPILPFQKRAVYRIPSISAHQFS